MSLFDRFASILSKVSPAKEAPQVDDQGFEDDEEQQEREKRHAFLVLWFRRLWADTEDRIDQLTERLAAGEIDSQGWAAAFRLELAKAHIEARSIGRRLAGHVGPFEDADVTGGKADWNRQEEFFQKFVADLETGRYTTTEEELDEKIFAARARQYAAALRGTANRSFKEAMGQDVIAWILGTADHCKPSKDFPYDCPSLANEKPKPADQWDTEPGGGRTPCRNFCTCHFLSEDGKYSTEGI